MLLLLLLFGASVTGLDSRRNGGNSLAKAAANAAATANNGSSQQHTSYLPSVVQSGSSIAVPQRRVSSGALLYANGNSGIGNFEARRPTKLIKGDNNRHSSSNVRNGSGGRVAAGQPAPVPDQQRSAFTWRLRRS